ncbi:hypothetical protein [Morganella morganii]|uniref:hypothetical protein n=1 Tax=Morganella morganii TaxID=582 RepID=UPI002367AB87|nr:hypothetical protein [Morganella morganii]
MIKNISILFFTFYFLPYQLQAKEVSNLVIYKTGTVYENHNDKYEAAACKKFLPTKEQIITYFTYAEESKENSWMHEYYSACISTGYVEFKDGTSGKWTIQSSGYGYVIFNDGSSVDFLYRNNKWEDPNACTYGLSDEPEPGC